MDQATELQLYSNQTVSSIQPFILTLYLPLQLPQASELQHWRRLNRKWSQQGYVLPLHLHLHLQLCPRQLCCSTAVTKIKVVLKAYIRPRTCT